MWVFTLLFFAACSAGEESDEVQTQEPWDRTTPKFLPYEEGTNGYTTMNIDATSLGNSGYNADCLFQHYNSSSLTCDDLKKINTNIDYYIQRDERWIPETDFNNTAWNTAYSIRQEIMNTFPTIPFGNSSKMGQLEGEISAYLLAMHNDVRQHAASSIDSLSHLVVFRSSDDTFAEVAKGHSKDVARDMNLGHNSPNGDTPDDRFQKAGINYYSGENLGGGYFGSNSTELLLDQVRATVLQMMAEPANYRNSHRGNILDGNNSYIGFGTSVVKKNGNTQFGWVSDFHRNR